MAETTEILKIEVDMDEAIKNIAKYNLSIDNLKKQQQNLKKELKDGTITQEEYVDAIVENEKELRALKDMVAETNKEVNRLVKENKQAEGSLNQMRSQLRNLVSEYDALSAEMRDNTEAGKEKAEAIRKLSAEIKTLEEETDRFQRSVGDYENSIKSAISSMLPFGDGIMQIVDESQELKEGMEASGKSISSTGAFFQSAGSKVQAFGKTLWSLVTNPVVAVLAGIAVTIMAVTKAIKSSEEQTNRVQVLLAPLQRLLDFVVSVLQKMVGVILTVVEAYASFYGWLGSLAERLPLVGGFIKKLNDENREAIQLEKDKIELTKTERKYLVDSAKAEAQVSDLKLKAAEKDKYTAQERLSFISQAITIEEEQLKKELQIAEERFRIAKEEAERNQNDAETNQQLAEMEAEIIRKRTDHNNKVRELAAQRVEAGNMVIAEEKAQAEAEKKIIEERKRVIEERKRVIEEQEKIIEDSRKYLISVMAEGAEKQKAILKSEYEEQKKALETKLAEMRKNGTLTQEVQDAINRQLLAMELKYNADVAKVTKEASEDEINKRIEQEQRLIELKLETVEKGGQEEFNLRMDLLNTQMEAELQAAEGNEELKLLITKKYAKLQAEERERRTKEILAKEAEEMRLQWENDLLEASLKGESEIELMKRVAEQRHEELENMYRQEGETAEQFRARQLTAEQAYNDQLAIIKEAERQIRIGAMQAAGTMFSAISGLIDAAAENELASVKLQQVLAIAQVMIQQAISIANVVANASRNPFTMAFTIAAGVAAVIASIVSAVKTINNAKKQIAEAEAQKNQSSTTSWSVTGYATGGLVTGAGTGTSDSIPAMLSNGEFVIPAATYKAFSGIIDPIYRMGQSMSAPIPRTTNVGTTQSQGGNIGADMLSEAFAKGASKIHLSPTVSVTEINSKQNNVKAVETRNTMRV